MSNENQKNNNFSKIILRLFYWLILIIIVVGVYYYWKASSVSSPKSTQMSTTESTGRNQGMADMATIVTTVTAQERDLAQKLHSLGTVTPSNTVEVRSQVTGPITKIAFEEGKEVKKGDLLFEIDERPFVASLQQAEAQLAQNKAQLANAELDLKRYQTLFKQDSIARQQLDAQTATVNELLASQKSLEAQIASAKLDVEYSKVVAPAAGRIGIRNIDLGNLVTANSTDPLVVITQMEPADVIFSLPESEISQVASTFYEAKEPLIVTLFDRSYQKILAEGQLLSMDNKINSATGTVKLKAQFDNYNARLFPNQFVNALLQIDQKLGVNSLETDAIQYGKQGSFVFVVTEDETVTMKEIKTGIVDGDYTEITEGLNLGDKVVIEGVDRLREGSKVKFD